MKEFLAELVGEELDTFLTGLAVAVFGYFGIKLKKGWSFRDATKRSIELAENLGELSEKPVSEIVRDELNAFSKEHLDCHRRIEGELADIKTSLAHIEGRLAQPAG